MNADVELFRFLNITCGWEPLTPLMRFVTDFRNFVPLVVVLVAWLVIRGGRPGRMTVLALLLLVPATDQTSSHLLKPMFARPRPCRPEAAIEGVRTHGSRCSSRGAFPSSHAANMGGVALLLARRHRRWAIPAAVLAFLVGYSRIFLGLHYPSDVLAGWLLGALLGLGISFLAARAEGWRLPPPEGLN